MEKIARTDAPGRSRVKAWHVLNIRAAHGGCRVSRTYLRNTVAAYGTGQYHFLAAGSSASATSWVMLQW
jgi:hypothetical protein